MLPIAQSATNVDQDFQPHDSREKRKRSTTALGDVTNQKNARRTAGAGPAQKPAADGGAHSGHQPTVRTRSATAAAAAMSASSGRTAPTGRAAVEPAAPAATEPPQGLTATSGAARARSATTLGLIGVNQSHFPAVSMAMGHQGAATAFAGAQVAVARSAVAVGTRGQPPVSAGVAVSGAVAGSGDMGPLSSSLVTVPTASDVSGRGMAERDSTLNRGDASHSNASVAMPAAAHSAVGPSSVSDNFWDIDAAANGDPQHCPELAEEIYAVLREDEHNFMPEVDYMDRQPVIDMHMRGILADWLVEVAEEYRLSSETLYLTMNYIDRYLSRRQVVKSRLQLVGVACCLMAAKYEEIYPPSCDDFVHISDNAYNRDEIFDMEVDVLRTLNFRLTVPTVKVFLRRCLRAAMPRAFKACVMFRVNMLANYICELTLLEYHCLKYLPSMIAAAAVCLSLHCCGLQPWDSTLEHYSHYFVHQARFRACVCDLHQLTVNAPTNPLGAVREKYASKKSLRVSKLTVPGQPPDFMQALQWVSAPAAVPTKAGGSSS